MVSDLKNDRRKTIPAPAGYVRFLLRRFATTPELRAALIAGTDIDEQRLQDAGAEVTLFTFMTFSENLCRVVGEDWPLNALPAWSSAMQGALEVAMRSASTVGDGLDTVRRFGHVRAPFLGVRVQRGKANTRLVLSCTVAAPPVAWRALSETAELGIAAVLGVILEGATDGLEFCFPWQEPKHAGQLRDALPGKVTFGQADCAVVIPNVLCARASPFADAALHATAIVELEQTSRRIQGDNTLVLRVEHLFRQRRSGRVTEEQAAGQLGLSRRTLVRRLAENQTTFRALLDADLKRRAADMLADAKLSRDQMAGQLGFAEPTSFSRACRRWFAST